MRGSRSKRSCILPTLALLLCLLCLLPLPARAINDTHLDINRSAICKLPRIPLLCESKLLRYAYDAATGNCFSLYTSGCSIASMAQHFLTFEECRRDRMQILRY